MRIANCLVALVACAQGIRVHRQGRRSIAKVALNNTNSSFAALQGFFSMGRWRDMFDQTVTPEEIGSGTFGVAMKVSLAKLCQASEPVVVKQVKMVEGVDSQMLNNELQIQQAISGHPNIVDLYDYHPQDPRAWGKEGSVFVMMPFAAGGHVDRAYFKEVNAKGIRTGKIQDYFEWAQAAWVSNAQHEADHAPRNKLVSRIAIDIFSGLKHMHQLHFVHRDLKPQNIWASHDDCMTKYSDKCKFQLGDFGISAPAHIAHEQNCGTPPFLPPEINTGGHPHHYTWAYRTMRIGWSYKGDVYALGLTLLSILTGEENPAAALGWRLFNIQEYFHHNILGLGRYLTELLVGALAPEPHQRITAARAHELAVLAFHQASGQRPPAHAASVKPMCIQECARMSCCYNLRCNILEGKCDDGGDPSQPAVAARASRSRFMDAVNFVVDWVGQGMGWVEHVPEDEPIGPVPRKILPSGKFCYEKDEIPAGERLLQGLLIPQERVRLAPGASRVRVPDGARAPETPPAPGFELTGPGKLGVAWALPSLSPPIISISVGVRVVGGGVFVVDATDDRNVLVPKGGQPLQAPAESVQFYVQPGQAYEAMVSFRNSVGPSQWSPASAPIMVPLPRKEEKLPPPPPPPLQISPKPTLELAGPHSLRISWTIPEATPRVENINIGLRVIGGQVFMVDTSDGLIQLVAKGGQPVRSPTTSIEVNVQPGFTYDVMIAMAGGNTLTSWSEHSDRVQVPNVVPSAQAQQYVVGDPVSYMSASMGKWLDAYVTKVDARGIQVNVIIGDVIPFHMLETKIRPRDSSAKYVEGDLVSYLSSSFGVWIDARVIKVDSQGIQVDVKPNEYIPFHMLAEKITHRSAPHYRKGELVSYWSSSSGAWVDAHVIVADARGIQVNVKAGEYIPPNSDRIKPRQASAKYARGDFVSYWSSSARQWLDAQVVLVDAQGVQVDVRPGEYIPLDSDRLKPRQAESSVVRPQQSRAEPSRVSRVLTYTVGQAVWYFSSSQNTWWPAIVINTDDNGVYVDVNPKVCITPQLFAQKLKQRLLVS